MKIVVVGRSNEVTGFALAGATAFRCDEPEAADRVIQTAAGSDTGLMFVTPWVARYGRSTIDRLRLRGGPPLVTVIPGDEESS